MSAVRVHAVRGMTARTHIWWPAPPKPVEPMPSRGWSRVGLVEMCRLRRDRRYRAGAYQMAVYAGIITQDEWQRLTNGEEPWEVLG